MYQPLSAPLILFITFILLLVSSTEELLSQDKNVSTSSMSSSSILSSTKLLYSLKDLEILSNQGNYEEFLDHAHDIRPSERSSQWEEMVIKMVDLLGQNLLRKKMVARQDYLRIEAFQKWPLLQKNKIYKNHRKDVGFAYLQNCFIHKSKKGRSENHMNLCLKDFISLWEGDKENVSLAFKLFNLHQKFGDTLFKKSLSPFFLDQLASKKDEMLSLLIQSPQSLSSQTEDICKNEMILESLWKRIEGQYVSLKSKEDFLTWLNSNLHPQCLRHLMKSAQKKLRSQSKNPEIPFYILDALGKVSEKEKDFFFTLYLLNSPSKGEIFNYAWSRLQLLKKSYQRRRDVLEQLKKRDPLPDTLFSSHDELKKKVILKHFKANFPEYLEWYLKECLSFYGGEKKYSRGNPTIECKSLMKSHVAKEIYDESVIEKFWNIQKIK